MNTCRTTSLWRCLHHVALWTHDLEATIRFYTTLLGMAATPIGVLHHGRYAFVKPEPSGEWGIYFLENITIPVPAPQPFAAISCTALPHIAFGIEDETAAIFLRTRLLVNQVTVTAIHEMGTIRNFLFPDNNGHWLEVRWERENEWRACIDKTS
jgi:catechol 2,3-dioxygenase-like lactoylglutathione lyase family enzyme